MWCIVVPKNKTVEMAFIIIIFAYSAKKNRANGPPVYSTLKPETSSDSPSVKSNGARFVSAKVEINHMLAKGQVGKINHKFSCAMLKLSNIKPPAIKIMHRTIRASETSYEIVWATARNAPISAYFEFEAHPEPRIE